MNSTTTPLQKYTIRKSADRGHAEHGWLTARHSFSFADYYDPDHVSYRSLRVINEDRIAPGKGFGTHPHANMEIFTYVISGQLEHKDSMDNGNIIKAGQFQYMSAGEGILHSEFNPSPDTETHLLQIWITPLQPGGTPRYAEADPYLIKKPNTLTLLASPDGKDNSIQIRQNANIHFGKLEADSKLTLEPTPDTPHVWIQMIKGTLTIQDHTIHTGDAIHFEQSGPIDIESLEPSEFILFQLA